MWQIELKCAISNFHIADEVISCYASAVNISKKKGLLFFTGYFTSYKSINKTIDLLKLNHFDSVNFILSKVKKNNWVKRSQENLPSVNTSFINIHGTHIKIKNQRFNDIILNAGNAFGSGHHESTLNAIYLINLVMKKNNSLKNIIDLGCGSGILSIVIAKIFKKKVLALDNDPLSCETTLKNAAYNKTDKLIKVKLSNGLNKVNNRNFQLILANILFKPLLEMSLSIYNHLSPKSYVILSGIYLSEHLVIANKFASHGFKVIKIINKNSWKSLLLYKE